MRAALTALAALMLLTAGSAQAAEIPSRFRGVWMSTSHQSTQCWAKDWPANGATSDNGLAKVSASSFATHEWTCDAKIAKTTTFPNGPNRVKDGPTAIAFACSGEGETEEAREVWDILSFRRNEFLIVYTPSQTTFRTYVRCQ